MSESGQLVSAISEVTPPMERWTTQSWNENAKIPARYAITNVVDSSGGGELVAWTPQRDRADRIAKLPLYELLFDVSSQLVRALSETSSGKLDPSVRDLIAEFERTQALASDIAKPSRSVA